MRTRLGVEGLSSAMNKIRPSIAMRARVIIVTTERLPSSTRVTKSCRPLENSEMGSEVRLRPNRSKLYTTMYTPSTKRPANSSVITILLKTLIFAHLEVLDYHHGPAPAGLRRHALSYVFGDLWYRPWQRVAGDDVDLQILWTDHHPRDFLAALVGCSLDEAPTPHGMDPFGRQGRLDRGPRELDSV